MRPQIVCHMMSSIDGRFIGEVLAQDVRRLAYSISAFNFVG